jgi:hypothetical protein
MCATEVFDGLRSNHKLNYAPRKREAISLTPWLQPGGQGLAKSFLNRFQLFLIQPEKTVRNGSWSIPFCYHRAEATVLMKSLRVPTPVVYHKATTHCDILEDSNRPNALMAPA